jgi:hypothetical protein
MHSLLLYITTCHAKDGVSYTPEHSNDIYLPSSSPIRNRRPRRRGMATSSPLHSDGSASPQPSSHNLHCITASNAALPSHKLEGLVGPLRPWSGSLSCGAPPRPRPQPALLPFARASRVDARTKTGVCERAVRANWCAHTHVLGLVRRPPCGERQGDKELNRHARCEA